MDSLTLQEIIEAWQARKQEQSPQLLNSSIQIIRLLSQGRPVSFEQFRSVSSLSGEESTTHFEHLKQSGCEFDENGHIIGNALTFTPSPYRLQLNNLQLFAWCALDTLFLPAYLQQSVQVTSTCFTTKSPIRLLVTPKGVETVDPPTTVLSVVVPGVTPSCNIQAQTGPQGPVCSAIHFFCSRKVAALWLEANPDKALLSIDEAWQLVYAVWVKPFQKIITTKA